MNMTQWRQTSWRRVTLLLVLGVAFFVQAGPPSSTLPGRKPDSKEPWGVFLGRAAHLAIGRQYRAQYPQNRVFLDPVTLSSIMENAQLGEPERLPEFVRRLRPDITDTSARVLFEIKPDNIVGREEARLQAGRYLAALNAAVDPHKQFVGGTDFDGSLFLDFDKGGALWQLS